MGKLVDDNTNEVQWTMFFNSFAHTEWQFLWEWRRVHTQHLTVRTVLSFTSRIQARTKFDEFVTVKSPMHYEVGTCKRTCVSRKSHQFNNFNGPIRMQNYSELTENRLSSSGIFSQGLPHWNCSRKSGEICEVEVLNQKNFGIESSSCPFSTTSIGPREEIQRNVFRVPIKSRTARRDSRKVIGHSLDQETKRCETGTFSRNTAKSKRKGNRDVDQLSDADYVPTNTHSSQGESQLYIVEDNEAVIKLIFRGRSPTTRHVSGTHSGAIDSLYGRINLNSRILIKYVDIKNQVADVLTKGRFTRNEWNHLLCLLNIMNFSMFSCSHFFL